MNAHRSNVEIVQAEIADLAQQMNEVIDNVIGAVPRNHHSDEFDAECFRDALKTARSHRYALESLSRQVGSTWRPTSRTTWPACSRLRRARQWLTW